MLILHTHATECYQPWADLWYEPGFSAREHGKPDDPGPKKEGYRQKTMERPQQKARQRHKHGLQGYGNRADGNEDHPAHGNEGRHKGDPHKTMRAGQRHVRHDGIPCRTRRRRFARGIVNSAFWVIPHPRSAQWP